MFIISISFRVFLCAMPHVVLKHQSLQRGRLLDVQDIDVEPCMDRAQQTKTLHCALWWRLAHAVHQTLVLHNRQDGTGRKALLHIMNFACYMR